MENAYLLPHLVKAKALDSAYATKALLTFVKQQADGTLRTQHRSYSMLWREAQKIAKAFIAVGLRKGDRVAVMMENHPEFVDLIIGASIVGVVLVPIDPRTRGEKLEFLLTFTACKGVVAADYCLSQLRPMLAERKVEWLWYVADGEDGQPDDVAQRLDVVLGAHNNEADLQPSIRWDDDMELMFTSGTTGNPKAIQCNYRRYALKGLDNCRWFGIRPDDVMYTGLSLTHGNAQNMSLAVSLYNEVPLVLSQKFSKTRLWSIVKEFGCTTMTMLGGMYAAIFAEPPGADDGATGMRLIVGAGMPKALWEPFARRFNVEILEFYSASEGGMAVNRPGEGPVGSIGRVVEGLKVEIRGDDDRVCPPGELGEMVFQNADGSPIVVRYFQNPEASKMKTRNGWLRSGDLAWIDGDGWLYFGSRKEHEIRRNGEFISSGFIEKEIASHPHVKDVYVYGVASEKLGTGEKEIVAAVVPAGEDLVPAELFRYCESRMEKNSVPSFIQLVNEIPKTASEKPIQGVLQQMFVSAPEAVFARGR
mgnify:CR=1 FL=1